MKTLNRKRFITLSAIAAGFISLFSFCFGSWTFIHDQDVGFGFQNSNAQPVAFIEKDNKTTYYKTIEKALESCVSSDKDSVYVLTGTTYTIKKDCTIPDGCSLILPYGSDNKTYKIADYSKYTGSGISQIANDKFADDGIDSIGNLEKPGYRKTNIIIAPGKTLTNKGNLYIGGVVGVSSSNSYQRPSGHTTKDYCQITLEEGAAIENASDSSVIECYGYIKNSGKDIKGKVTMTKGTIWLPMVIYDFKGGSYTKDVYKKIFPFEIFDFPNMQSEMEVHVGANVRVWAKITTRKSLTDGDSFIREINDFYLYTSDTNTYSMFKTKTATSYFTMQYKTPYWANGESFTKNDATLGTSIFSFYGSYSLSHLKATISLGFNIGDIGEIDVDSSKYHLPLCFKYHININQGDFNVDNKVKFMTGSVLNVAEGSTLNINNETSFYTSFVDQSGVAKVYPSNLPAAECNVYGNLQINSKVGGLIKAKSLNAKLTTTNSENFENSVATVEINETNPITHMEMGKAIISYNNFEALEKPLLSGVNYSSYLSEQENDFYWTAKVALRLNVAASAKESTGDPISLTASFMPNESFFDLSKGISWSSSGAGINNSSTKPNDKCSVTQSSSNSCLATFTIKDTPTRINLNKDAVWHYSITAWAYDLKGNKIEQSITVNVITKGWNI